jgi:hypothetical protein
MTTPTVIAREGWRSSIPEAAMIEPRSRSVLDAPPEPVIGLAEGETRWRGMTAFSGAVGRGNKGIGLPPYPLVNPLLTIHRAKIAG